MYGAASTRYEQREIYAKNSGRSSLEAFVEVLQAGRYRVSGATGEKYDARAWLAKKMPLVCVHYAGSKELLLLKGSQAHIPIQGR